MSEVEEVKSVIETGICIGISAKFHPHPLEEFHERPRRIMRASVECHVFEEMGQTALIFLFLERARENQKPQRGTARRLAIRKHDITEAVCQRPEMGRAIRLEITGFLWKGRWLRRRRRWIRENYGEGQAENQETLGELQGRKMALSLTSSHSLCEAGRPATLRH